MLVKELYVKLIAGEIVKIYSIKQNEDVWLGSVCYIPCKYMLEKVIAIYSTPFCDNYSIITIVIK